MFVKIKRLTRMVLTVLGVSLVMYSSVNLSVESIWRRTNTQRNARAASDAETHKNINEKSDWYKPLVGEREDTNLPVNQTLEWDFLVDLPVREEENNDSEESTELDTAFNFPSVFLNHPSAPPEEWENRVPLSAFPRIRVSNCKGKPPNNNSLVYPCKPKRHATENEVIWPTILEPSNGALLRRMSQRRYDDPKIEQLVDEQMEVQMRRLARVAETCEAYPGLEEKLSLSFVWAKDRDPPLVYCPIYKSASTTWMTNFLRLEHLNDDKPKLKGLSQRAWEYRKFKPRFGGGHQRVFLDYPKPETLREKRRVFKNAVRFIVVRHPFDRLVSVYRDKIARPNPLPFRPYFQDLQRAIVGRYRHPGSEDLLPPQPTFSEFVDYLIESTENLKTMSDWTTKVICWTPYWVQCGVCTSDYQMVIKVETMKSDEQLLAHVANLTEIQDGSKWENKRKGPPPDFFKTLTTSQVKALYRRYKEDFDLFGYTIDEYLSTAREV